METYTKYGVSYLIYKNKIDMIDLKTLFPKNFTIIQIHLIKNSRSYKIDAFKPKNFVDST